ncbi:signal peptide peptidase-like 2B isoform X3 [Fukomys damarensis]|uniref:signal peptide peptidase-like 2B isoform X3 n=1 Tax=Fukomys damarensis TaxID=885580 RepID=UPI001455CB60|nr:signal peptide peptidase-like 2B isoform X3 [Fukomys damarensis]
MGASALTRLGAVFLLFSAQVACEYGMVHVVSETGVPRGKDYCILYNPQWAHLPHDLGKASLLQLGDWSSSLLCSPSDLPASGFSNQIPLVARGNCTFYEKVRLAQGSGARGLLVVSKEKLVPPGGNKTQYEEIGIPVALLSYKDMLDIFRSFGHKVRVALYAPSEPVLDYNMVIIFIMAVGTVALGGYWAGSRDVKKRYMKHKRDDGPEKQEDEAVDVTPVMICVFVVMCCSMLVLLYYFYDHLVYVIIGIFCLASSTGLYSCLAPCVRCLPCCGCRVPDNSLPYFHKRPQARMLLLGLFCVAVSVVWGIFRNEDQWAWVLQDALGIAFCLYMLKTIRLPTFKACTLLLLVLFIYDVFFVFITPFLTKLPMVLKVPRLNSSPLALCDRPFSLLGFGDILVPGLLVAYCHRFDVQVQSSRVYFVASTIAYGIGLLVTFVALALMQRGQPALLYLVPCTLVTSCAVALWRRELGAFWTGSGFVPLSCRKTYLSHRGPRLIAPSLRGTRMAPALSNLQVKSRPRPPCPLSSPQNHLRRRRKGLPHLPRSPRARPPTPQSVWARTQPCPAPPPSPGSRPREGTTKTSRPRTAVATTPQRWGRWRLRETQDSHPHQPGPRRPPTWCSVLSGAPWASCPRLATPSLSSPALCAWPPQPLQLHSLPSGLLPGRLCHLLAAEAPASGASPAAASLRGCPPCGAQLQAAEGQSAEQLPLSA